MADASTAPAEEPDSTSALEIPSGLVADIEEFKEAHDGASAVIEYVGRRGARIVLVGEDGSWADQFAPATDVAREACTKAGVSILSSWERELSDQMRGGSKLLRAMRRGVFAR
jgi:hypothetical protein